MKSLLQQDIDILFQSQKELYMKLDILTRTTHKIQTSLEGILISDSYSINANSDVRRTYSCEVYIESDSYLQSNMVDFMKYYVRPYIGIKYQRTNEILWYLVGTFCVADYNFGYDAQSHILSMSCEDLMCLVTGNLNGNIKDVTIKIPSESDIRTVLIGLLNECGITIYSICDIDLQIPYDLEYSSTSYYTIFKDIIDLYIGYEMFFDINGVFTIQKIPTGKDDDVVLTDDIIQTLLISDNGSSTFQNIYNHIKVYGMQIDTDRYTENCTYNSNIYSAIFDETITYENSNIYTVKIPTDSSNRPRLTLNSLGSKYIMKDEKTYIQSGDLVGGVTYSFRYRKDKNNFLLLGQYQIIGEAWDNNLDSPFNINNLGYEIMDIRQGDEYEKIYTDDLANKRARREIYLATQMKNDVHLDLIFIPWLDVNIKCEYTSKNFNNTYQYIIKSINGSSTEATMTIDMIRYYEDYSEF